MNCRKFTPALFCLFFFACQEKPSEPSLSDADMPNLLQMAYERISPEKVPGYSDINQVKLLRSQNGQLSKSEYVIYHYTLAKELLNAGKSTEAIVELEGLISWLSQNHIRIPDDQYEKMLLRLALSYLRLGEEENCNNNPNEASCIIPIEGAGIYQFQAGPKKAIEIYLEILNRNPNCGQAIWFLNFANMTIGAYPAGVPEAFLISPAVFSSEQLLPKFENIAAQTGTDHQGLSGGVCVDDFNGDYLLDIFATSWSISDGAQFYVNEGNGRFADRSKEAGVSQVTGALNTIHADYNNDGHPDILVLRGAWLEKDGRIPNSLLRNNGDGTFKDVTISAGLYSEAPTQVAAWADFNNDGFLDLFVGNESHAGAIFPVEFFVNDGNGIFSNIAASIGLDLQGFIKGCAVADVDNDGWEDLYISYYNKPNDLWHNQTKNNNGKIAFKNIASSAGVNDPVLSFPCWFFDYNNDGWQDLFVSGYGNGKGELSIETVFKSEVLNEELAARPRLFQNEGIIDGQIRFNEISQQAGLSSAIFTMGSNFGDLDNDGFLDFYLGTGTPDYTSLYPNRMYRNNRGEGFQDVTYSAGFGHIQKGHGIGWGDLDNDGDQDIYAVMGGAVDGDVAYNALFENPIGNQQNWIVLLLKGTKSNASAIGTKIEITIEEEGNERKIYRRVGTGSSFGGNTLRQEIGVGKANIVKKIEVKWLGPAPSTSVFENVATNSFYEITEGRQAFIKVVVKSFNFSSNRNE